MILSFPPILCDRCLQMCGPEGGCPSYLMPQETRFPDRKVTAQNRPSPCQATARNETSNRALADIGCAMALSTETPWAATSSPASNTLQTNTSCRFETQTFQCQCAQKSSGFRNLLQKLGELDALRRTPTKPNKPPCWSHLTFGIPWTAQDLQPLFSPVRSTEPPRSATTNHTASPAHADLSSRMEWDIAPFHIPLHQHTV